ncbi:MAG: hypothetical protein DPW09_33445 [Anaerolineae bacterium]|nr:hypothetical protein [Anaerolineae bacterium]
MSRYKEYAEKPTEILALTGYTHQEFEALLPHFRRCYYERMKQYRLDGKPRGKRAYSDYKNSPLPLIEDKLFFILSSLKTNNLQTVQGALVGISQPKANVWIHCLHPVLNQALAELGELPVRQMEQMTFAEDEETIYFHDGTERPIPRPCDPEQQRLTYSGKRKRHGLKNNVLIDMPCKIRFLSHTVESKKHDKKLADETVYTLPEGSKLCQDTGFQGFTLDNVAILQPKKKPKGKPLSDLDKSINHWLSSLRVRIEHAIGGVKRYRIIKDKIRNWKSGFRDAVLETCCGLHNFRLNFRPWTYDPIQLHLFVNF